MRSWLVGCSIVERVQGKKLKNTRARLELRQRVKCCFCALGVGNLLIDIGDLLCILFSGQLVSANLEKVVAAALDVARRQTRRSEDQRQSTRTINNAIYS